MAGNGRAAHAVRFSRALTVEREVEPALPAVRGDAAKLRHALQNLVENAMRYDGGRRWVAVRAAFDEAADEVVLSVVDRGRGIAPGDLPHVFEPFYRGQEADERQIRGFGLGLALVRRTVQDHGGSVGVASTPGCGATFTVRLPAVRRVRALTTDGVDGLPNPSV
jgi:signal transduction histidine kinase